MASQVALVVMSLPANAGDLRDSGSTPGLRRSPGKGHGNPLQYSCLENPMGRGAWRATVRRVAKSWTQLKWLSMQSFLLFECCTIYMDYSIQWWYFKNNVNKQRKKPEDREIYWSSEHGLILPLKKPPDFLKVYSTWPLHTCRQHGMVTTSAVCQVHRPCTLHLASIGECSHWAPAEVSHTDWRDQYQASCY